jgi:hypothetical protein
LAVEPGDVAGDVDVGEQLLLAVDQQPIAGAVAWFVEATLEVLGDRRLAGLRQHLHDQRVIAGVGGDDLAAVRQFAHGGAVAAQADDAAVGVVARERHSGGRLDVARFRFSVIAVRWRGHACDGPTSCS